MPNNRNATQLGMGGLIDSLCSASSALFLSQAPKATVLPGRPAARAGNSLLHPKTGPRPNIAIHLALKMDDDAELEMIRQRRIAEMQAQAAARGGGVPGGGSGGPSPQEQEARQREMEERRRQILAQLLTAEARERLARINLVKPEKARRVEDMIIGAAQSGQLGGKVNEANLISLLDQISEAQQHTKITYQRKKWDSDE